ncbi:MAG: anthranilate synthase component II [Crocinitomicaceae bacterium]
MIDNYDSFTYNLVHYIESFDVKVDVRFNDKIKIEDVQGYDKIVFSPGPGLPSDAGFMNQIIHHYQDKIPMLGVCLGFQAIAEYFGGKLYNQNEVKHGVSTLAKFDTTCKLFKDTAEQFKVGLYHSWAVSEADLPSCLKATAKSSEGILMAYEHDYLPIAGVQFHPESILSQNGKQIVKNFLFNFD